MKLRPSSLALLLTIAGCGTSEVDPCRDVAGTCLGLQIDPSAAVSRIDSAIIAVSSPMVTGTKTVGLTGSGDGTLPIAVALAFDTVTSGTIAADVTVDGLVGGVIVGRGEVVAMVTANQHQQVRVRLDAPGVPDLGMGSHDAASDAMMPPLVDLALFDSTPPPDLSGCMDGLARCLGNVQQKCVNGQWTDQTTCAAFCANQGCVNPPSCSNLGNNCGQNGTDDCCHATLVAGGTFLRSYDAVGFVDQTYTATLSDFILDQYEVTVGRFRQFEMAYPADKPLAGTGANPNNVDDKGWDANWTLPPARADLDTALACSGTTWSMADMGNEQKPLNCVDWFTAFAFCIWDGGRLPTEAEWNYAASGGNLQRVYPWSVPPKSSAIDSTLAVYGNAPLQVVGAHSPMGDGYYGQSDLAGNVMEWALDWYTTPYPTANCPDCANLTPTGFRVLRGGSFMNTGPFLVTSARTDNAPTFRDATVGFRCAHAP